MKHLSAEATDCPTKDSLESGRSTRSVPPGSISGSMRSESNGLSSELALVAEGEPAEAVSRRRWAAPLAAEALRMRGRLALLDGKLRVSLLRSEARSPESVSRAGMGAAPHPVLARLLRDDGRAVYCSQVCRHHASRGLAVLVKYGYDKRCFPDAGTPPRPCAAGSHASDGGVEVPGARGVVGAGIALAADAEDEPWRVIRSWLELRHDLAVVALLQVSFIRGSPREGPEARGDCSSVPCIGCHVRFDSLLPASCGGYVPIGRGHLDTFWALAVGSVGVSRVGRRALQALTPVAHSPRTGLPGRGFAFTVLVGLVR